MSWRDPDDYSYLSDATRIQWAWEFLRRNEAYRAQWKLLPETPEEDRGKVAEAWGLEKLVDPEVRVSRELRFVPTFGSIVVGPRKVNLQLASEKALYLFDLSRPLGEQVEQAASDLRLVQEMEAKTGGSRGVRRARGHVGKWRTYIRVLDAYEEDASLDGVATVLFPDVDNEYPDRKASKKVSRTYKQARLLVCGGFTDILFMPSGLVAPA